MKKTIVGVLVVVAVAASVLYFRSGVPKTQALLLYTWSNYFSDELLQGFTAKTGIPVQVSYITSNEELLAKMKAGASDYDLIMPSDYMVRQMANLGMLSPIDKSQIKNVSHLDPYFQNLAYDPGLKVSIPFVQGTTGIAVNTEFIKVSEPVGWDLLFNSPSPNRTSMLEDIREVFAAGLLYNGKNINERAPEAINAAAQTISNSKDKIALFSSEPLPKLLQGEVHIAHTYSTHGVLANIENPKIKYFIPKEGASIWTDNFAVPTTSARKVEAHQFIDYFLNPDIAVQLIAFNKLASPNLTARKRLPASELRPEVYPAADVLTRLHFLEDLGPSLTLVNRLWTELRS